MELLMHPLEELTAVRRSHPSQVFVAHLNINSLQNKFDKVLLMNEKLRMGVFVITETKLDSSYPDVQFKIPDYRIYRQDRKIKPSKNYKTIEVLPLEVNFSGKRVMVLGIYSPPRKEGAEYYYNVEEELNHVTSWAMAQCPTLALLGDLNLDRLKPREREGKFLIDLEEINQFTCLITEPTRVTPTS
ncbi:predicted protein [Nematostella vectensis]|uniref:DNA-(apurinic or apyrimidinic site) endonuclease n=1 Tax=Nematostella vectensis TaxID=45351 RepID=A7RHK8_NEMVE|nr:predicted protein [Nematostella vectensis]|eukprot:XP_001640934.1 predicted protein [Nematostella vectensis]